MFMRRRKNSGLMTGSLIGVAIGAAGALLFAPKSGRQLREDLMDQARQTGETARNMSNTMIEMGSEWTMDIDKSTQEASGQQQNTMQQADHQGGDIGYVIKEVLEDTDIYNQTDNNQ